MKIVEVLKMPRYLAYAALIALAFSAVYIYTQVLGILENLHLWFTVIPLHNAILFSIFAGLFGITMSFQVYRWKQPKVCAAGTTAKSSGVTGTASMVGLLVAQCPACASLGALFLPVSAITFIGEFSAVLNLLSIGLLLFTIHYLGGFRKGMET